MKQPSVTLKVWDPAIRLFHWLLVAAFTIAYIVEGELIRLHLLTGSIVLGLVIFRLIWGVIGSAHARFGDFAFTPRTVWRHLVELARLRATRYIGHTPAGSYMIFALLAMLLSLTLSGTLLYGLQEGGGPLAAIVANWPIEAVGWVKEVHDLLAQLLVLMVLLHIAGVLLESVLHRENLILAMLTGNKPVETETKENSQ